MKKTQNLYSVKVRASKNERHISGSETIVEAEKLEEVILQLFKKSFYHERGKPDFLNIKVELLKETPVFIRALDVYEVLGKYSASELISKLLSFVGVDEELSKRLYSLLLEGPSPSKDVMRGAIVMDFNGVRYEPDSFRGVRVKNVSVTEEALGEFKKLMSLSFTQNFADAIALASKVIFCGAAAELCISDDPSYTTGYLSIGGFGYIRIKNIKPPGLAKGGRIFFFREKPNESVLKCLESKPVIVKSAGDYLPLSVDELLALLKS